MKEMRCNSLDSDKVSPQLIDALGKNPTLLSYVVFTVQRQYPELLDFHQGLTSVSHAAKVSFISLREYLDNLITGFSEIEKTVSFLSDFKQQTNDEKLYINSMKSFLKENSNQVKGTKKEFKSMI